MKKKITMEEVAKMYKELALTCQTTLRGPGYDEMAVKILTEIGQARKNGTEVVLPEL